MKRQITILLTVLIGTFVFSGTSANTFDGTYLPSQYAEEEGRINRMVGFLEHILNTVGNDNTAAKDKEEIISTSYLKLFANPEVQIEDDLDQERSVVINKSVQAYLKDVDFFYKNARFKFTIEDISVHKNDTKTYFKVRTSRALNSVTLEGQPVSDNITRFIEINFDESTEDLKIASIYTTKLSTAEFLKKWWDGNSFEWKVIFKRAIQEENEPSTDQLKKITQLKTVDVSFNKYITDYKALTMLEGLEELNVSNTKFDNLNFIRNCRKLKKLDISNTPVTSLSELTYLKSLQVLIIDDTHIKTLQPLYDLDNLQQLYCRNTDLPSFEIGSLQEAFPNLSIKHNIEVSQATWWSEIDNGWKDAFASKVSFVGVEPSLSEMSNIESIVELDLTGNGNISTLDPVKHLKNIKVLKCAKTNISDISTIVNLRNLEYLDVSENWVSDISPLYQMNNLKVVNLDKTQVSEADIKEFVESNPSIRVIHNLMEYTIWYIKLPEVWKKAFKKGAGLENKKDITPEEIFDLLYVKEVDLTENRDITDLEPLKSLKNLEVLKFGNTMKVNTLEPLRNLKSLKYIDCSFNPIEDLEPLMQLSNLKFLNISNTYVNSLEPLKDLFSLETIYMNSSKVTDLKHIRNLENLREIKFSSTSVNSLSPLITLMELKKIECFNAKVSKKEVDKYKSIRPDVDIIFY